MLIEYRRCFSNSMLYYALSCTSRRPFAFWRKDWSAYVACVVACAFSLIMKELRLWIRNFARIS